MVEELVEFERKNQIKENTCETLKNFREQKIFNDEAKTEAKISNEKYDNGNRDSRDNYEKEVDRVKIIDFVNYNRDRNDLILLIITITVEN